MRALVLVTAFGLVISDAALAQEPDSQAMPVDAMKWGAAPPVLPKGGQMAVLSGDPSKSGPFTVRLKMPAGYKIPPHRHPHREPVTVISGELHFGSGDKLDEKNARTLGSGGFVDLPENANHFAFALVETVIQISAEGPFGITYANSADDPSGGQ
jgi:quercetin dioxygenase-like cupin family protein